MVDVDGEDPGDEIGREVPIASCNGEPRARDNADILGKIILNARSNTEEFGGGGCGVCTKGRAAGEAVTVDMLIDEVKGKNPVLGETEFEPLHHEEVIAWIDGSVGSLDRTYCGSASIETEAANVDRNGQGIIEPVMPSQKVNALQVK